MKNNINNKNKRKIIIVFSILLIFTMILCVHFGTYKTPINDILNVILYNLGLGNTPNLEFDIIVWEIRLPRIILAALVGVSLSISGTVFQGVFKNPLVEPYILGVSSGAACGAALSIVLGFSIVSTSMTSFIFAMIAMGCAYIIAKSKNETPLINLILAGTIISSIFTSMLNLLKIVAKDSQLREITFWLMGGFYTAKWEDVLNLSLIIVISCIIIWCYGWKLNLLTIGDDDAKSMGVNVNLVKLILIIIATFITSISVSTVGIISWVGLMIPHMARMTIGSDHRYLIPLSGLMGGIFLVICDTIARSIIMGEIPISIITSILGTPYLIYLLKNNRQVHF